MRGVERAQVHLGQLQPEDVTVELYVGRVDLEGDLVEGQAFPMIAEERHGDGTYKYAVTTSIDRSGLHGFTVRVRPHHPDMSAKFIPGMIWWAHESRVAAMAV